MSAKCYILILCLMPIAFGACKKQSATAQSQKSQSSSTESDQPKFDACSFIKNDEIEAVQGSPIKETKNSGKSGSGFETSQCFYMATEFSRSVSLSVTRADPNASNVNVKDYWKQTFGRYAESQKNEKEEQADKEKKESLQEQRR